MKILSFFCAWLLAWNAVSWCETGQKQRAQELYGESIELLKQEKVSLAIDLLLESVELDPGFAPSWNALGLAYMGKDGYAADAIDAFTQSLELSPAQPDVYANLGIVHSSDTKDYALAEEYLTKALAMDPENLRANFGMGWVNLWHKQDGTGAVKSFKKVLKKEPENFMAHYGVGMAYLAQDNRAMALKSISMLRKLRKNDLAIQLESLIQPREEAAGPDASFGADQSKDFNLGSF